MTDASDVAVGTARRGIAFALQAASAFAAMDGGARHLVGTCDVVPMMWVRHAFFIVFGCYRRRARTAGAGRCAAGGPDYRCFAR